MKYLVGIISPTSENYGASHHCISKNLPVAPLIYFHIYPGFHPRLLIFHPFGMLKRFIGKDQFLVQSLE